ncbi:hypothetical protein CDAR_471831 [Caerostris darwini]|uniref:Uncharacterized protein n=1 Tax=Caerostris darwini TaxID=1538125 RepID=A0AAV4RVW3_9ARAC|nr:hypothetical protein CDAR_471831 [Caerostris darwini]
MNNFNSVYPVFDYIILLKENKLYVEEAMLFGLEKTLEGERNKYSVYKGKNVTINRQGPQSVVDITSSKMDGRSKCFKKFSELSLIRSALSEPRQVCAEEEFVWQFLSYSSGH